MRMSITLLALVAVVALSAFPVASYDFQLPQKQASPVAAGMGGLNLSVTGDPCALYACPSLLVNNSTTTISLGMKLQDRDQMDVAEMFNASNVVKRNQIVSLCVQAEKGGFGIRPLVDIDEVRNWSDNGVDFRESEDYQLTAYQLGLAETQGRFTYGIGMKYLYGRLVYLREHQGDEGWLRDEFTNDRLHGCSFDFSVGFQYSGFTVGLTLWDIYSHLWWLEHEDRTITKRVGCTVGWQMGKTAFLTGTQRQWNTANDQTYHVGVQHALSFSSDPEAAAGLLIRAGAYSHDFESEETIWSSLGVSYYLQAFRVDASMAAHDLALANTRFLITLSLGM